MIEYRVKWKREGLNAKRIKYTSLKFAERRAALLTSDKPWLVLGLDPADYQCCSGYECGCGGITVREHLESQRSQYPALEYVLIEQREVGKWTAGEVGDG
ncbi:hypothetical protein ACYX7E_10050 [Luteimonas sp. RIT-PG2_3]